MPVSLIGTFVFFPLFGFSINTLSLFGLVLAIGLVVDDAIVVVEAVERHIEEGMSPKDAALKAMEEISGPVIGIALVLSAVFVPTAFIPGHHRAAVPAVRRDHRDLGDPLGVQRAVAEPGARRAAAEAEDEKSRGLLRALLRLVQPHLRARHRTATSAVRRADPQERGGHLLLLAVRGGGAGFFGGRLPTSFLPGRRPGLHVSCNVQLPNAASLQRTEAAATKVEEILLRNAGRRSTPPASSASACSASSAPATTPSSSSLSKEWNDRNDPRAAVSGRSSST